MRNALIDIHNLSIRYKNFTALYQVTGRILQGSMTAIVGPNGGGKSTLLKSLVGLIPVFEGKIRFHNIDRRGIAYLPQKTEIDLGFPLTVEDVVGFGLCQRKGFFQAVKKPERQRITEALEEVGLRDYQDRLLNTLSGGQLQRVLFARMAVQNASLLLLDEPFAAVDMHTIEELMQLLQRWNKQGKTIIMVSHDLDLIRQAFTDCILLARKCLGWGATGEILSREKFREAKNLLRNGENPFPTKDNDVLNVLNNV